MGRNGKVFAIGRYQIIPQTLRGAVSALHLDTSRKFTPAMQEKIFSQYLISMKRPDVRSDITGKGGVSRIDAERALSYEWASIGDPDKGGRSHYGGANSASISPQEVGKALDKMRAQYRAEIEKGTSASKAWQDVMHTSGGSVPSPAPSPAPSPS